MFLLPDGKILHYYATETLTDQRTGPIIRYLSDGTPDPSFSFSGDYRTVEAAAPTASGQLIIAAIQYLYGTSNGMEQILRVNAEGSIDPTFNSQVVYPFGFASVRTILVQPDGKILVAGNFDIFGGSTRHLIVRLMADGTVDSTFTSPQFTTWTNGVFPTPVLLQSGKILIAGDFTLNGINLSVARLNPDGSVDSSFQPSGFSRYGAPIRGLAIQSDGKILVAGRFQFPGGGSIRTPLIRLEADGALDATYMYTTQLGPGAIARDLVIQPDGKAVVPMFTSAETSVYRFDATGPLDATFAQATFLETTSSPDGYPGFAYSVKLQGDGRIVVGGYFTDVNPTGTPDGSHFGVARLNSDGTLDTSFATTHRMGLEDFPSSFLRTWDGTVLTSFRIQSTRHDPAMAFNVGRLSLTGSIDTNFALSSSDPSGILSMGFMANDFVHLSDGAFFIFGTRTPSELSSWTGGKFRSDGVQDLTFDLDPFAPYFQKAVGTPNGRVLLAAGTDPQATVYATLSQIRGDGTRNTSFLLPPSIFNGQVIRDFDQQLNELYVGSEVLAVAPNGKILFLYFWSDALFHFVRLNADGSIDTTFSEVTLVPNDLTLTNPVIFDPVTVQLTNPFGGAWSATPPLQDAVIQADGRIILCGPFTSFNGVPARGLVRLLPNGSVDNTFSIGGGAQWTQTTETSFFFPFVESVEEQINGKLLISGTFEAFNGTPLPGIASLNTDGSVDPAFIPPAKRLRFSSGTSRLARQSDGSFLLSGPYAFPNENKPTFIHIDAIGGAPVVGSLATATAVVGQPFSYQIEASGHPTEFDASGLPGGFAVNPETGLITGTPTSNQIGIYNLGISATNDEGEGPSSYLTLSVIPSQAGPPPSLRNISTRLKVLTGDNALIGGFIITGFEDRRVIIRGIGPSLSDFGVPGALADTVLELHGPGTFVTITNDNWRDTQQSEIEATGIPPTNDLESAIVATLPPGAYTAIVRGKADATGVGLVEAYDLGSTENTQLANISTRGFVDVNENVMIGGLIAGPAEAGSGRVLVRAIGPSLTSLGVPNALQDPALELHNGDGDLIASNNDWKDTQQAAIEATGIAPSNDHEAAIVWVLSPGTYTAVVRGADNGTGVGLVEVYNLQ